MLQMKLAGTTIKACDALEEIWFGDCDTGISRSYIVRRALADIYPKRSDIEWEEVRKYMIANYDDSLAGRQTALELTDEEIQELTIMQQEFVKILDTKRVYKPFVVKMIVMAELFYLGMEISQEDMDREKLKTQIFVKAGTLNVHGFEHERTDYEWDIIEDSIIRNDIMALQEFVPENNCDWVDRCRKIKGVDYAVITPEAWNRTMTKSTIAVTLIRAEILKDYTPLLINNDKKTLSARYTYGKATFIDGTKVRIMNVYMPQLVNASAERIQESKDFWNSLLKEIENIPFDEKFILLGDFNAGKKEKFVNHDNFNKLCQKLYMLDKDEEYLTYIKGKVKKRLDYIFVSGSVAMNYTAVTGRYAAALNSGVTDHIMLEVAFISSKSYIDCCRKLLKMDLIC